MGFKPIQPDNLEVLGIDLSEGQAGIASTAANIGANLVKTGPGAGLQFVSDYLQTDIQHHHIVQMSKEEIARSARELGQHVTVADLEGEAGVNLVNEHPEWLTKSLRDEWDNANQMESGLAKLALGNAGQFAVMGALGGPVGLAGGIAANFLSDTLVDESIGAKQGLSPTAAKTYINNIAVKVNHNNGEELESTADIPAELKAVAVIAGDATLSAEFNDAELVKLTDEAANEIVSDTKEPKEPGEITLKSKMEDLEAKGVFTNYVSELLAKQGVSEEQANSIISSHGGGLQTIAAMIEQPEDIGNIYFKPKEFAQKIINPQAYKAMHQKTPDGQEPAIAAAKNIHNNMQSVHGQQASIPNKQATKERNPVGSGGSMSA